MLKKLFFVVGFLAVFGLIFNFSPAVIKAQTVEEIRAQIAELLSKIADLRQQLAQIQSMPESWCYDFDSSIKWKDTGRDVEGLQSALEKEGFSISSDERTSGYFYVSTLEAAMNFQRKHQADISKYAGYEIDVTGFVGKGTRAKLNELYGCGITPPQKDEITFKIDRSDPHFVAEIGSSFNRDKWEWYANDDEWYLNDKSDEWYLDSYPEGALVSFVVNAGKLEPEKQYYLNWGFNGPGWWKMNVNASVDNKNWTNLYYACDWNTNVDCPADSDGNKQILIPKKFNSNLFLEFLINDGMQKGELIRLNKKVSIGTNKSSAFKVLCRRDGYQWSDTDGCVLSTNATPSITVLSPNGGETIQIGSTYTLQWKTTGDIAGKYAVAFLTEGPSEGYIMGAVPAGNGSQTWKVDSAIQGDVGFPIQPGKYKVRIAIYDGVPCFGLCAFPANNKIVAEDTSDNYFSIVAAGENLPPVIDGLSAPTQLKVNETGIWTIKSHDPENGLLTYSVRWGDEVSALTSEQRAFSAGAGQTSTFTHSYNKTGNYTISFTVTDDHQQTAKTSTTVNVVSVTTPSITVLSPNGGESWGAGEDYLVRWKVAGITRVDIELENWGNPPFAGGPLTYILGTDIPAIAPGGNGDEGNYFVTLPSGISGNYFKVRVVDTTTKNLPYSQQRADSSDNYFSIVAAISTSATSTLP